MTNSIKRERNSTFELLRIIAMLAIVFGHVAAQAFDRELLSVGNNSFLWFFGSGSRIGVNLFVMIGVWFMVDSNFKAETVFKLYSSLWLYSVAITIILIILHCEISTMNVASSFFPFLRRRMWFVPQYISLLLISPFLKLLFCRMSKKTSSRLIIIALLLVGLISSIRKFEDTWLAGLTWFVLLYFVIAHYKKHGFQYKPRKELCLVLGTAIYIALATGLVIFAESDNRLFEMAFSVFKQYLGDYKSIPNFLCALLIFVFFAELDIGQKKWINEISKNTLDVYMIHQQDVFIPIIWVGLFHTKEWQQSPCFILLYLGTVLAVYVGGSLIGRLRVRFVEPLWLKSRLFRCLSQKMNKFYEPVLEQIREK